MFVFDCTKLRIENRVLVSVSQSTTQPKIKFKDDPKVGHALPFTSARGLIKNMGGTGSPMFDVPVQILYHEDQILAVECKNYTENNPDLRLIVNIEKNFRILSNLTGEWFWDGQHVFRRNHTDREINANLKTIGYDAYDTYKSARNPLEDRQKLGLEYVSNDGMSKYCSVPLLESQSQMAFWLEHVKDLNRIDMLWNVNLRGMLYVASTLQLCKDINFAQLEVMKLPQHMVELQTLSLVSVEAGVKWATPAKMSTSHMMVWMLGLMNRVQHDIEQVQTIASAFTRVFNEMGKNAKMGHFTEHYFETAGKGEGTKVPDINNAIAVAGKLPPLDLSFGE